MYPTRILRSQYGHGQKPNITGFDPREFAKAAGQPRYDPWERADAWRYTGHFSRFNRFKKAFPGLGVATVAFGIYLGYDHFFSKDEHHHGEEGHGEGHH